MKIDIEEMMRDTQLPTSDNYHPYKISHFADPNYSADYISLILNDREDGDLELKIMLSALRDVFEALGEPNMSDTEGKLHLENLENLLSQEGTATIYALASWLQSVGLKLTVAVDRGDGESSANVAQLAQVANI